MLLRPFLNDAGSCASYLFGCTTYRKLAVVDAHADLVDDYLETAAAIGFARAGFGVISCGAVERLGQTPPSGRQMFALRAMGLLIPPSSAGILARVRGVLLIIALILLLIAVGLGIVELVALPFGGLGLAPGILLGLFVAIAALAVIATIGRRRRGKAAAARSG